MKMNACIRRGILSGSAILLLNMAGWSQKILKDTTFIIVKQFQPTIADAFKIHDVPVVRDSVPPAPKINYSIQSKKVNTPYTVDPIKPAKMVGEPLQRLYPSLVRVGAGTYLYGEGFYNNTRSKEGSYGAHLRHLSWNGTIDEKGFSGFSDNEVGVYGKKFLHKSTLSGGLYFDRHVIHYYNYDTNVVKKLEDNDLIRQHYFTPSAQVRFQTHFTDTQKINTDSRLKFYRMEDYYGNREARLLLSSDISGYYEKQLFHAPLSIDYANNRTAADSNGTILVGLTPFIDASGKQWSTRIGVGIFVEGGQHSKSRFAFAPNIDFNFNVLKNIIIPYGGVTGGIERNSVRSFFNENPFLIPAAQLENTYTKIKLYGGVRGSLSKSVSYNTRASFASMNNEYFFVNDNSDPLHNGFNVVYDNATLLNLHGELQYQHTEKIKLMVRGDYNSFSLKNELKPWHKPIWETALGFNYNLRSKIVATADLVLYGTRYSYSPRSGQGFGVQVDATSINELKPVLDASIGLEYRYSKKLSAFLNLNNLGFRSYERWNNYPTHKFNFLAGVTMAF